MVNKNSIIIYSCLGVFIALAITGHWGGLLGVLSGLALIYFLLANDKEKQNIRDNLLWRSGK